jgi:hypothetical protein
MLWGAGNIKVQDLLGGVKYSGGFVGSKAATIAMKALHEPGNDGRTGSCEVKTVLGN